jgi:uncharacterized protein YkwD
MVTLARTFAAVAATLLAALAIAARPVGGAAASAAGGVSCAGAEKPADQSTRRELRRSVRCLLNEERAVRGLAAVARDESLQQAAQRHSKVMAATDCLAHRCAGEADLEGRVRKAGYFDGAQTWRYAENTGCGLSAEAMVSNWMESDFHRINILEGEFRDLGVGVVDERVKRRCGKGYATFAVVLGWRNAAQMRR